MPLLITLFAIVLINWVWSDTPGEPAGTRPSATAVAIQSTTTSATVTRPPILPATILPSPTPTLTPLPIPDTITEAITLLGPPPESSVAVNGRLAFYWTYPKPLLPGQQFVLTLQQNETVITTQTIAVPNLGDGFQLPIELAELALVPGTAVWQLHLEWADDPQQLLTSEARTIILLPE
ncbi:MAG: hypothetical protein CL608_13535 [Anaerolineaceae bacterium]|nr:hypothetical protein [Anaerolineaceae bacterium]